MPIGSWNGSAYTGLTGLVAAGYNGGAQNGPGIMTSESHAISPNVLTQLVSLSNLSGPCVAPSALAPECRHGPITKNSLSLPRSFGSTAA